MKTVILKNQSVDVISSLNELNITSLEKTIKIFNSESNNIDKYILLLEILTPLSVDEIEDLELEDFKILASEIDTNDFIQAQDVFINEVEFEGVKYKTKSNGNSHNFTVKEIFTIQKLLKKDEYILEIAAIIFRPVDANGKISNDMSQEAIDLRKIIFKDITIDVILPYVLALSKTIINEKGK